MGAVSIFIALAFAGCAFLLYFLYALWQEEFRPRTTTRVEITKLPTRRQQTAKLIRLYVAREGKRL
jgi:threonine/homoserine/homoserine lactone efflux protein